MRATSRSLHAGRVVGIGVDDQGMVLSSEFDTCDYAYVTPSHQFPTTVTMSLERRHALLERAASSDVVLIEDDYESELAHQGSPQPALKSLDRNHRVIFVSSLSKTLAPGLRMGFMVGPAELIREARALRRLMIRHPAANNQRTVAMFLADGHHDALLRRLCNVYRERLAAAITALVKHLPEFTVNLTAGGTALWIRGPKQLDMNAVEKEALKRGVVIEPGAVHFMAQPGPANYFRLGVSSIPTEKIETGIKLLAEAVREQLKRGIEPREPTDACKRWSFMAVLLVSLTLGAVPRRRHRRNRHPSYSPIPRRLRVGYGLSFMDYDECGDGEAGRLLRRAVVERFEQCPFTPEAKAKFQAFRLETLEHLASEYAQAWAEEVKPKPVAQGRVQSGWNAGEL